MSKPAAGNIYGSFNELAAGVRQMLAPVQAHGDIWGDGRGQTDVSIKNFFGDRVNATARGFQQILISVDSQQFRDAFAANTLDEDAGYYGWDNWVNFANNAQQILVRIGGTTDDGKEPFIQGHWNPQTGTLTIAGKYTTDGSAITASPGKGLPKNPLLGVKEAIDMATTSGKRSVRFAEIIEEPFWKFVNENSNKLKWEFKNEK